jgi:drug/metabolite transporter (DMT)-like permease
MSDGALTSEEKRQSAALSGHSDPPTDAGRSAASNILRVDSTKIIVLPSHLTIFGAASETLKRSWFWYSIAASLCWTAWAFTARLGSEEIPPTTMQFVSAFGFLLVGLVMVAVQKPQLTKSLRGNCYALISGILLGLGGIALYGAYRTGDNASVVTATTSLYPVATVLLAVTFLHEKINKLQLLGVCFAVAAILLLSS